jgi:hypothetical protein
VALHTTTYSGEESCRYNTKVDGDLYRTQSSVCNTFFFGSQRKGSRGKTSFWKPELKKEEVSFIGILMLNSCISLVICVQKIYMQQQKKIKTTKQKH